MTPLASRDVVLEENLGSGHAATRQARAHATMAREGLRVLDRAPVQKVERLCAWVQRPAADHPLVVVAGGPCESGKRFTS